jgi:DNA-directed RNA polymerase II subunit RPB1
MSCLVQTSTDYIIPVTMCALSPLQRQMSVTQKATINNKVVPEGVTRFDTYQNGLPVYGGVSDPRMGTFDARARCKTCDCTYTGSGSEKVSSSAGYCLYRAA